jgi:hypothetical protein
MSTFLNRKKASISLDAFNPQGFSQTTKCINNRGPVVKTTDGGYSLHQHSGLLKFSFMHIGILSHYHRINMAISMQSIFYSENLFFDGRKHF